MTTILIIEDETLLREEIAQWLSFEGYDVITAPDGLAGVERAQESLPDLIICDILMPRLDGFGVVLELQAHPRTAAIPFIFLTAKSTREDMRQGMVAGADDYVTKPFSRAELMDAITTRLAKKAAQTTHFQEQIASLRAALEQQNEQRMLKTRLVAMISHDFRTPLSTILASNNLLRNYSQQLSEERRVGHMNRIEGAVHQLLHMLDDMLTVAQVEAGHLECHSAPFHFGKMLQQVIEEIEVVDAGAHHIILNDAFGGSVVGDLHLIRQVAMNLLSNATKYSPADKDITVTLRREGSFCMWSVQDQGIGIHEADQAHIFEPFQRGSNVGYVKGTGLGLSIVKHILDLHGFGVSLESTPNVGTTVTVSIPLM
jgi:two-component system, sensor histidine kinase and response regulator